MYYLYIGINSPGQLHLCGAITTKDILRLAKIIPGPGMNFFHPDIGATRVAKNK